MKDINCWEAKFEVCIYSDKLLNKLLSLNKQASNKIDLTEVRKAIYYAKKYHGIQKRQSGEPYYSHPLEVAYMLAEYVAEESIKYFRTDLFVTAILHDTLEDTKLTFKMIKSIFGYIVANQVMDITRIKEDGYKISSAEIFKSLWLQKKNDILLIKQLDRLHNMQTIEAKSIAKIKKTANETFNSFIVYWMHMYAKNIERKIYQLCCKNLSIKMISYEFSQTIKEASHLCCIENGDTHRFLSQVFQNVTTQTKN